jgi:predicted metal-binding membrane protein
MGDTVLVAILRRDRTVVLAALLFLTALAWIYLLHPGGSMTMPPADSAMPGMDMGEETIPVPTPWTPENILLTFSMWLVMMVGMMTPSVAPVILIYARLGRQAETHRRPFGATSWFAGGYFLAWTGFSLTATIAQLALRSAALLDTNIASNNALLSGIVFILVGAYQWTKLKQRCLTQCQAPLLFIQRQGGFKSDARGAFVLGVRHGVYCVGCCWPLMLLLFIGGVMNLLWIAGIAILTYLEKNFAQGRRLTRLIGVGLIIAGGFVCWFGANSLTH